MGRLMGRAAAALLLAWIAIISVPARVAAQHCASMPCANGAACTESGDGYTCRCGPGFANGVCEYDYITEYDIECNVQDSMSDSSLGGNCDIDVDECASDPCQNGATCAESLADSALPTDNYRCECTPGFVGENCDMDDPCAAAAGACASDSACLAEMSSGDPLAARPGSDVFNA